MSAVAESLDHLGVAGRDLAALASSYAGLGFTLTPLARHSGRRTPDGPIERFGTGNRCIMLREGYLELITLLDPAGDTDMRVAFERPGALHIIALGMDDEAANRARMRRAGIDTPEPAYLERPVDDADPHGPTARFARLPLPGAPEGKLQLVRHFTPEAIWQDRFLDHANQAVGLTEVILAVASPAETGARFSRLAGLPLMPDPVGGMRLDLARGTVRILPPEAVATVLPGAAIPRLPFIAGMALHTADRAAAARRLLAAADIPHREVGDAVLVAPEAAGGAGVLFR